MNFEYCIDIESTTAENAALEMCGVHIRPSSEYHLLTDCDMVYIERLAADMRIRGWRGAPVIVADDGNQYDRPFLVNGRHRCVAACLAGIPIQMYLIPWELYSGIDMDGDDMEKAYIPRDAWL